MIQSHPRRSQQKLLVAQNFFAPGDSIFKEGTLVHSQVSGKFPFRFEMRKILIKFGKRRAISANQKRRTRCR